jgi:hypothetical protein
MADQFTNSNALGIMNTGASSAGVAQDDPNISLGGYASSTPVVNLTFVPSDEIPGNYEVLFVSGNNGEGSGILEITDSGASWEAPGSFTAGPVVPLVVGTPSVLEDGLDPEKFIVVTRQSTDTLTGTGILTLEFEEYNAVSMRYASADLATLGGYTYRSIALVNSSDETITGISVYSDAYESSIQSVTFLPATGAGEITSDEYYGNFPMSGYFAIYNSSGVLKEIVYGVRSTWGWSVEATGRGLCGTTPTQGAITDKFAPVYPVELALEDPISDQITASVNENTAPAGITYSTAFTSATAVTKASLASGAWVGLHLRRTTAEGSEQIAYSEAKLRVIFTCDGTDYNEDLWGIYRVAGDVQWQLYYSDTSTIDFNRDPDAVGTSLPLSLPVTLPSGGTKNYWYTVRYRNRFGLTSLNQYPRKIAVTSTGELVTLPPSSPYDTALSDANDGYVTVTSLYNRGQDEEYVANKWAVWASEGVNPDPDNDTPVLIRGVPEVNTVGDGTILKGRIGPYGVETDLRVLVRVYRTSDNINDGNTDIITMTTASGPDAPREVLIIR